MARSSYFTLLLFLIPFYASAQPKKGFYYSIPETRTQISQDEPERLSTNGAEAINAPWLVQYKTIAVAAFEVSQLITLREYKQFLSALRRDSGDAYYRHLLPDSTIGSSTKYALYLSDPVYESYPAVGVSWENALLYCLWRSLRETGVYYRLPTEDEWLAANIHLSGKKSSDFNKDYADWILNPFYENPYGFVHDLNPNYKYKEDDTDPSAVKRKRYIGNSFFISFRNPMTYKSYYQYKNAGHPFLGFRCVRVEKADISTQDIIRYFINEFGIKF